MEIIAEIQKKWQELDSEVYSLDEQEDALLEQLEEVRKKRSEKNRRMEALTTTELILKGMI